jgi:pyridinium-3,5-bisthiocarboxylic acid mononucleotide nickel chelatase
MTPPMPLPSTVAATVGWLDCSSGCSGDMLLGALLDVGVPVEVVREAVAAVAPQAVAISTEPVHRGGFAGLHARVEVARSPTHRDWADIRGLLDDARLDEPVRRRAHATFARLAEAEGAVHGVPADTVHFHEVGALDAIADVVGVCAALDHLGLEMLAASPVALGGGTVRAAHGTLGVPAPAVVELLRGVPTHGGPVELELCTPTGAALLAEWVTAWGPQPAMTTSGIGVGAGGRDIEGHANVLRLLTGAALPPSPTASSAGSAAIDGGSQTAAVPLLMECNVDDLDPRLWPGVLTALLDAGASDAWLTPILMKKGRPAHMLSVLAGAEHADTVRQVVFTETTTLGVRETVVGKHALQRREEVLEVDGQRVRVKLGLHDGRVVNAQPEYEDVAAAAVATGQPVKQVLARAVAQARSLW